MEEQRQRQEDEQRRAQAASSDGAEAAAVVGGQPAIVPPVATTSDESMLERALALSTETPVKRNRVRFTDIFYVFYFGPFFLLKFFHLIQLPLIFSNMNEIVNYTVIFMRL